jgi:hypothetical protein
MQQLSSADCTPAVPTQIRPETNCNAKTSAEYSSSPSGTQWSLFEDADAYIIDVYLTESNDIGRAKRGRNEDKGNKNVYLTFEVFMTFPR